MVTRHQRCNEKDGNGDPHVAKLTQEVSRSQFLGDRLSTDPSPIRKIQEIEEEGGISAKKAEALSSWAFKIRQGP